MNLGDSCPVGVPTFDEYEQLYRVAQEMLLALEAVKRRLDRNGISGRQLPEYSAISAAVANARALPL